MQTKNLIKTTIFKLLEEYSADDLSVKMLCLESGISKQTLYNHYYSIMDVIEEAYKERCIEVVGEQDSYRNWAEVFRTMLMTLAENRNVTLHLYYSSHRDEFMDMINKCVSEFAGRAIEECSADIGVEVSEKDKQFMLDFYMYVVMGIVDSFLGSRMKDDPDYLVSRSEAMMRHHIRKTLRNMYLIEHDEQRTKDS